MRQSLREALADYGWPRVPGKEAASAEPSPAAVAALERRINAAVHAQVDLARIKVRLPHALAADRTAIGQRQGPALTPRQGTDVSTALDRARRDSLAVLELWRPLHLRLVYHFASGADTAQADRPEWLLSFVLNCLRCGAARSAPISRRAYLLPRADTGCPYRHRHRLGFVAQPQHAPAVASRGGRVRGGVCGHPRTPRRARCRGGRGGASRGTLLYRGEVPAQLMPPRPAPPHPLHSTDSLRPPSGGLRTGWRSAPPPWRRR